MLGWLLGIRDVLRARSKEAEYRTSIDREQSYTVAAVDLVLPRYALELKVMNILRMTGEEMRQEHSATVGSLSIVLQSVRMEIDDDDEDIIEVELSLTNESAMPIGGVEASITTSLGATVEPISGVTSIGPGLTRSFSFAFKLSDGEWTFNLDGQGNP